MLNPRPKILVADAIAEDGLARLRAAGDVDVATGCPRVTRHHLAACEALVVRSETRVTATMLDAAPNLRVIGRACVGVDTIDIEAASQRGILVLNARPATQLRLQSTRLL